MPAVSKKQRQAAAIAKHAPEKLYKRNRAMTKMSEEELHKFAATKEKGLPEKKKPANRKFQRKRASRQNRKGG